MLRTRILTAAVLVMGFSAVFFLLDPLGFLIAVTLVAAVAAWEWARLCVPEKTWLVLFYAGSVAIMLVVFERFEQLLLPVFQGAALAWCLAPWLMMRWHRKHKPPPSTLLLGLVVLLPAFLAIMKLRWLADGTGYYLWVLLLLVWSADIGAYFAGKRFGRRKLAPRISPGKTWEGVAGGMVGAVAVGMLFVVFFQPPGVTPEPGFLWLIVCLVTAAFSILGDLTESLIKRMAHVKDSGVLLPGHGGLLDRIDGVLAASPVFVLALFLLDLA